MKSKAVVLALIVVAAAAGFALSQVAQGHDDVRKGDWIEVGEGLAVEVHRVSSVVVEGKLRVNVNGQWKELILTPSSTYHLGGDDR
jgi:hypothetical protein